MHQDMIRAQTRSMSMLCGGILRQMDTSVGVETWFKFTRTGIHMTSESEEGSEREEPILFCREANLCGTVVGAVLWNKK